jgi:hypothetical protein
MSKERHTVKRGHQDGLEVPCEYCKINDAHFQSMGGSSRNLKKVLIPPGYLTRRNEPKVVS